MPRLFLNYCANTKYGFKADAIERKKNTDGFSRFKKIVYICATF